MIVALDFQEPARAVQAGGPELLVEQGIDEGAGVLVVDDGDDKLHRAEYQRDERPGSTRFRGVYDAGADRTSACRSTREMKSVG